MIGFSAMMVEIYTTRFCATCYAAKELCRERGIAFREIDVSDDEASRMAMAERAGGRRSVPQIFVDGRHVGGLAEFESVVAAGALATRDRD
jgi:glutaredoxin 3